MIYQNNHLTIELLNPTFNYEKYFNKYSLALFDSSDLKEYLNQKIHFQIHSEIFLEFVSVLFEVYTSNAIQKLTEINTLGELDEFNRRYTKVSKSSKSFMNMFQFKKD